MTKIEKKLWPEIEWEVTNTDRGKIRRIISPIIDGHVPICKEGRSQKDNIHLVCLGYNYLKNDMTDADAMDFLSMVVSHRH